MNANTEHTAFHGVLPPLTCDTLPAGIRSRYVNVNGLRMHFLEAGYETPNRPCILLLHGFPELAYSWRKNMLPLASHGFHVIAPDQRGYGRTTGWADGYDIDLTAFGILNLVCDIVELVTALGYRQVQAIVGHDSGVQVAATAALIRPDLFRSLVLMSAPYPGPPMQKLGAEQEITAFQEDPIHRALGELPRPRKHYQLYYSTRQADHDLCSAPQGLHRFLRAYFHYKSADWNGNAPVPLREWTAEEAAKMPTYYIMDRDMDMPASVAPFMPDEEHVRTCVWLTERELQVYTDEYRRTGFQGGLNWYRCGTNGLNSRELALFSGRSIDVPTWFVAGCADWCPYQLPGALDAMAQRICGDFRGCYFIPGAGHWVQQEQPEQTNTLLMRFIG